MKILMAILGCSSLACCIVASAQTSRARDPQVKNGGMQNSDNTKAKSITAVGCVGEKDGKYLLMNKQYPAGVELMSSDDMKTHVGHKVKVTGMMGNGSATDGGMTSDNQAGGDAIGTMTMEVASMKMMSGQCDVQSTMQK